MKWSPTVKRAVFMAATLFPAILTAQYLGHDSVAVSATMAGIIGGVSVILFPDPNR